MERLIKEHGFTFHKLQREAEYSSMEISGTFIVLCRRCGKDAEIESSGAPLKISVAVFGVRKTWTFCEECASEVEGEIFTVVETKTQPKEKGIVL